MGLHIERTNDAHKTVDRNRQSAKNVDTGWKACILRESNDISHRPHERKGLDQHIKIFTQQKALFLSHLVVILNNVPQCHETRLHIR